MVAMEWSGSHVVITGGSSGIGEALAHAAAERGAKLTLLARGVDRLEAVAAQLRSAHRSLDVGVAACDVSDQASVKAVFAEAVTTRGPVDALICSAGITL